MLHFKNQVATFVASLTFTGMATAGLIVQPLSVQGGLGGNGDGSNPVTNMGEARNSYHTSHMTSQNQLSASYTSGVTDFDAFISSTTHDSLTTARWHSTRSPLADGSRYVDFELDGIYTLEGMAIWNYGGNSALNLVGFNLLVDDNAAFSSPVSLGSFTATNLSDPSTAVSAEAFVFTPVSGSHIRMQITANNSVDGLTGSVSIGEVAFKAVPEPATFTMFGLISGAGLFIRRIFQI